MDNKKITLEIPEIHNSYTKDKLTMLPSSSGIYSIYSLDDELLYIGKSINLRSRLFSHFEGKTHTSSYCHEFYYVNIYLIEDKMKLDMTEIFMINTMEPKYNSIFQKKESLSNEKYEEKYEANVNIVQETVDNDDDEIITFGEVEIREHDGVSYTIYPPRIRKKTLDSMAEFFMKHSVPKIIAEMERKEKEGNKD